MIKEENVYSKTLEQLHHYLVSLEGSISKFEDMGESHVLDSHIKRKQLVEELIKHKLDEKGQEVADSSFQASLVENAACNVESDLGIKTQKVNFDVALAELYLHKRKDSLKRGIDFELTIQDLSKLIKLKKCQYTGINFVEDDEKYKRSFDRLDSTKGYTKENTYAVCYVFNQIKNTLFENPSSIHLTPNELLMFANKMAKIM